MGNHFRTSLARVPLAVLFVLVFFPAGISHASAVSVSSDSSLLENLVSYWSLEESSGTRYATSGTNHLTDNNTVGWGDGKIGFAADCEASNTETLSISDGSQSGLDITGDFSSSMWIKPETINESHLFAKWNHTSATSYMLTMGGAPGYLELVNNADPDGFGYTSVSKSHTFSAGTWYHVVSVYDASEGSVQFYVNGTSIGAGTGLDTSIANTSSSFRLCGRDNGGYYDGMIDEVGIWNKKLSATDVANLYNGGDGIPYQAENSPVQLAVRKSANESVVSSDALQNDDDLELTLEPSTEYLIDAYLVATTTSRDPGMKVAFSIPSGSEMLIGYLAHAGIDVVGGGVLTTDGTTDSEIALSRDSNNVVRFTGTIKTGSNGGAFTLQWAQYTGGTSGVTVRKGSYLQAEEI